uniref:Uncharacterized protein n=1 Tax=Tetranychus urticae TaxID=32264 RepID=T1K3Y2_TETUR
MQILIRKKLSWMFYLLCFTGFSIQIYHLTCNYLRFKVQHEVTYDYADQVELPTVDIIIPMVMTINLTELFTRYPEQMANLCKKVNLDNVDYTIENFNSGCAHEVKKVAFLASHDLALFIKVKDINELTIDPREQIDFIQIANANFTTDQCKMTRYYNGWAIFLRISCAEKAVLITDSINIVSSYEGNIATIGHSFGSYFGIRFTSQFDIPVFTMSAYFMIIQKADKLATVWVRYEKIVSRSLPYPYETNCRFHQELRVLSDCKVKQSFHKEYLLKSIVNEWGSQPDHLGFNNEPPKVAEIKGYCFESRILDCEKTTYLIDGEVDLERVNHASGLIFIEKPVTPTTYFNVHPELLLSQYLIFVGSIIGTWFAFSIFDNLNRILTWIESKIVSKTGKGRGRKSPIKLFTIRNSHNLSYPARRSI